MNQKSGEKNEISPRKKIMDLLARRDHSELELRRKLSADYEADQIRDAIEFAKQNKWLRDPTELALAVAAELGRKNKGAQYIQAFLSSRGLPSVSRDVNEEHRKALELIATKLRAQPPFEVEFKNKIVRLLKNRGFDDETIRKVIHEKS